MRIESSRWRSAERGHAEAVAALLVAASLVPDHKWTEPLGPGRWSPAQVLLHIEQSYRLGDDALRGGPGMRVLAPSIAAWFGRNLMLPMMTLTGRFPRNAPAPREVRPDAVTAHAIARIELTTRVQAAATQSLATLREVLASGRRARVTHAYFGALTPYQTLRILNAHTRHHAKLLAPPKIVGKSQPCVPDLEQIGV
ncbi:MAG: hypothetical protein C0503_08170 [Gemmatimonas sp.]|nr:hypothetical protein [Gemmatimonas sp.]